MPKVVHEFSRFAHQYNRYNIIQSKVAETLVETLPSKEYKTILDIGCGSGEIFKNLQKRKINFDDFVAFDSSSNMLNIHPADKDIVKVCADFNKRDFFEKLPAQQYDLLLSSSALQWSRDLDFTLEQLSRLSSSFYVAIFTSGTFKTLHKTANIDSPIYSLQTLQKAVLKHYNNASYVVYQYTLEFSSVREMFQYIKKSGVSSGEKKLSYKQIKSLMRDYPLDYLEFEVLFVKSEKKKKR